MLLFLFVVKENKTLDSYSLGLGRFVIVGVWNAIKRTAVLPWQAS